MRAAGVRLRSTASSPPPSSMTSTRRLGLPTCWRACRITPPSAFTNSCLGIGALRTSLTPPKRSQLFAQNDLTRVLAGGVRQNQVEIPHFAEVGVGDRGLRGVHCQCHRLPAWLIMSAYVR